MSVLTWKLGKHAELSTARRLGSCAFSQSYWSISQRRWSGSSVSRVPQSSLMIVHAMIDGWWPSRAMMPSAVIRARSAALSLNRSKLGNSVHTSRPSRSHTS